MIHVVLKNNKKMSNDRVKVLTTSLLEKMAEMSKTLTRIELPVKWKRVLT
jgi:hypothetical protein